MSQAKDIEKYLTHLPSCLKMQDWTEAITAMGETPQKFRDEDWQTAYEDMRTRMNTCSCGLEKLIEAGYIAGAKDNGWIDVNKELPKNNDLCNDMVMYWDNKYKCVKIGCYDYESDDWTDWGTGRSISKFKDVTHWQPLPKPPIK